MDNVYATNVPMDASSAARGEPRGGRVRRGTDTGLAGSANRSRLRTGEPVLWVAYTGAPWYAGILDVGSTRPGPVATGLWTREIKQDPTPSNKRVGCGRTICRTVVVTESVEDRGEQVRNKHFIYKNQLISESRGDDSNASRVGGRCPPGAVDTVVLQGSGMRLSSRGRGCGYSLGSRGDGGVLQEPSIRLSPGMVLVHEPGAVKTVVVAGAVKTAMSPKSRENG
ncbi:hypothetical protein EAG_13318 [Camponotus floridanus]|uniref:Uncharacterized protein n=1 Tax=Camponotus floridanus TaxID=104421 RepID=E2A1W2_CAMFO|nr:hypothetical protein EAG_13318 [Camponotus floridanus]